MALVATLQKDPSFNTPEGVEGFSSGHRSTAHGNPLHQRFNTPEGVEGFSSYLADVFAEAGEPLTVSISRRVLRGFRAFAGVEAAEAMQSVSIPRRVLRGFRDPTSDVVVAKPHRERFNTPEGVEGFSS